MPAGLGKAENEYPCGSVCGRVGVCVRIFVPAFVLACVCVWVCVCSCVCSMYAVMKIIQIRRRGRRAWQSRKGISVCDCVWVWFCVGVVCLCVFNACCDDDNPDNTPWQQGLAKQKTNIRVWLCVWGSVGVHICVPARVQCMLRWRLSSTSAGLGKGEKGISVCVRDCICLCAYLCAFACAMHAVMTIIQISRVLVRLCKREKEKKNIRSCVSVSVWLCKCLFPHFVTFRSVGHMMFKSDCRSGCLFVCVFETFLRLSSCNKIHYPHIWLYKCKVYIRLLEATKPRKSPKWTKGSLHDISWDSLSLETSVLRLFWDLNLETLLRLKSLNSWDSNLRTQSGPSWNSSLESLSHNLQNKYRGGRSDATLSSYYWLWCHLMTFYPQKWP